MMISVRRGGGRPHVRAHPVSEGRPGEQHQRSCTELLGKGVRCLHRGGQVGGRTPSTVERLQLAI